MVGNQYDVYWVNLDPTIGSEIKKTRPCVVISPDEMNKHINKVIIAPLTTSSKDYPTRVKTMIGDRVGCIVLDQISCIDQKRILNKICSLKKTDIAAIKKTINEMLVK